MKTFIKAIPFLLFLVGCVAQGEFIRTDPTIYTPKPKSYDMPLLLGKSEKAFKEIGRVTVTKQATTTDEQISESELIPLLKTKGQEIGADALVDLKFETFTKAAVFSARVKHALKASATAIVYVDSLTHR
jgi:hypothetical protein